MKRSYPVGFCLPSYFIYMGFFFLHDRNIEKPSCVPTLSFFSSFFWGERVYGLAWYKVTPSPSSSRMATQWPFTIPPPPLLKLDLQDTFRFPSSHLTWPGSLAKGHKKKPESDLKRQSCLVYPWVAKEVFADSRDSDYLVLAPFFSLALISQSLYANRSAFVVLIGWLSLRGVI